MPRIAYVNGGYVPHEVAAVHIEDRGFQFADGVYEAIALVGGRLADEEGHLDRLERSLAELGIAMPVTRKTLQMVVRETIRRNRVKNAIVYMQVTRGAAPRTFQFPKNASPTLVITLRHTIFDREKKRNAAYRIITVPDIRWKRRDIKATGLTAQVLAKQAAIDHGVNDAWMVDDAGFVTEASAANAWIVDPSGNLITRPAAQNNILKGVTRNALQALCKREKIKIIERPFTPDEACKAKEAFTSAAITMIVPVVEIDGKKIGDGKIGPMTSKILDLYMDYALDGARAQERWNPA